MTFKAASLEQNCTPSLMQCGLCGGHTNSFEILSSKTNSGCDKTGFSVTDLAVIRKVTNLGMIDLNTSDLWII